MNYALIAVMAERLHPFFTASPFYPHDPLKAFEDGKNRFISTLQSHIEAVKELTPAHYSNVTNSTIFDDSKDS